MIVKNRFDVLRDQMYNSHILDELPEQHITHIGLGELRHRFAERDKDE